MKATSRFATQNPVTGFVALDNVTDVCARIERLVTSGRPMVLVERYTHLADEAPPDVYVGMVLDERWPQPVDRWQRRTGGTGMTIRLRNSHTNHIVNVSAYPHEADTERAVNHRYTAEEARDHICNITRVHIQGDVSGDGRGAEDHIVIDAWNSNGVCTQTVIAFDATTALPRRDDKVAAWLKARRDVFKETTGPADFEIWNALNALLETYLHRADAGRPLDWDVDGPFDGGGR